MDPTYPNIDSTQFPVCDWGEFYGGVEETILCNATIPHNDLEAIGKVVGLHMFVHRYHAGDH